MPRYITGGKRYNIPDEEISAFEAQYPDATIEYHIDGEIYDVPLKDKQNFVKKFPNATTTAPKSTIEQLREDTKKREEAAEKAYNESEVIYNEDKPYRPAFVPQQAPVEGVVQAEAHKKVEEMKSAAPDFLQPMYKAVDQAHNARMNIERGMQGLETPTQREYDEKMESINQAVQMGTITPQQADVQRKALEIGQSFSSTPTDDMIRRTNARGVAELSKVLDERMGEKEAKAKSQIKSFDDAIGVKSTTQSHIYTPTHLLAGDADYRMMKAAKRSLNDAQAIIDEADHQLNAGNYTDWQQTGAAAVGRGMQNKLFDVRTWDMGMTDAHDVLWLREALDKADNGEELTEAEKALLDAKAYEMAVNAYFGSYVGMGYTMGQGAAESIPFMLEFAINPLSAVGKTAQNKLVRYALKKYGKGLFQKKLKYNALKYGTRLVGDLVGGGTGMTLTSSLPRTIADATSRTIGQIKPEFADYTGRAEFGGTEGGVSAGRAAYKAIAAGTFERFSEMMSYYTLPAMKPLTKAAGKVVNKFTPSKVTKVLDDMSHNLTYKQIQDFFKRTQWHGVFGESLEEVGNNVLNAAFVGDMNFGSGENGVFNPELNKETFFTVALTGGYISTIATAGYGVSKYKAYRGVKRADEKAADYFGEDWATLKPALSTVDSNALNAYEAIEKREDYTNLQKAAAKTYLYATAVAKGATMADLKRKTDAERPAEDVQVELSYDAGRSLYTPEEMNRAKMEYELQLNNMRRMYALEEDGDVDAFLGDDPLTSIRGSLELGGSEEEAQAKLDYLNAKATYYGMLDQAKANVNDKVARYNALIDRQVNKTMNGIQQVTLNNGEEVFVIDGIIAANEDGSIDRENTDKDVIYLDANGKAQFTSRDNISSAKPFVDVATYKQQNANNIIEQGVAESAAKIDGVLAMNVGDKFYVMDDRGLAHQAQVTDNFEDGNVAISIDNAEPQHFSREAVQAMANAFRAAEYQAEKAEQAENERKDMQQAEVQLQQEEDEKKQAEEQAQQAEQPVTATSRVPVGENGNLLYEQADSDTAWDALVEQAKGNEATAQKIADMGVKKAQKALDEVKQSTINEDMSIEEMLEAENAHNDAVAAAEANLNKWKEIASTPQRRAEEAQRVAENEAKAEAMQERIDKANEAISEEQKKAEQRMRMSNARAALQSGGRYQRENAELGAPLDFADYVMRAIATGGVRFIWGNNPRTGTRGLGSHTGFGEQERRKRIGILSNEGMYPEVAAEQLLSSYADEIGHDPGIDTSDALSTILDVVMSHTTPKDMMAAAQARHAEAAEREAAEEYAFYENEYMKDAMAYDAMLREEVLPLLDEHYEEFQAIFAEEYLKQEEYDRSRQNQGVQQGVHRETRDGASSERGGSVLQETQSHNGESVPTGATRQSADATANEWSNSEVHSGEVSGEPKSVANKMLSEEEYINQEVAKAIPEGMTLEEFEETEEYIDTFNAAADNYPAYVKGLADSGELQQMFDSATIGEQIAIRKNVEATSFDIHDLIDTKKNAPAKKTKKTRGQELMENLGLVYTKETDSTPQMRATEGEQPGSSLSRAMNMLRIPLRKRINKWSKKVGVPVEMVEDFNDVTSKKARINILAAQRRNRRVTGWVEDGKVYLYMPMLRDIDEIDETYIHEVVAHKGMDAMLGKEEYRKFCLNVFDQVMSEADRKTYLNYEGVSDLKDETEKKAKAADEYIAHLSEGVNLTKNEATLWNKIVDLFRKMLESLGFPQNISKLNIEDMIRKSYNNLLEGKDVLAGDGKIQFSVKDNEATETIFATAKEKFGTTYDMREAGYILPDGSMLDFSGKHEIRGADTSFLNGQRSVDHRAIQDIAYDFDENETGVKTDLGDFLDRGAIRIDYKGAINLNNAPTKAQKDRLKRLIERNGGDVYIDFGKGWDTEHYVEYESARASRVLGDIDRYYEEGIKPSSNIRFRVADDIAAEQKQIIAEAKANGTYLKAPNGKDTNLTPEQWAMVRTKAFKRWFGDWELTAIYNHLLEMDAIKVKPMPKERTPEDVYNSLPTAKNKIDGTEVRFFNSTYKKIVKKGGLSEIVIASLGDIFQHSILAYTENDNLGGTTRKDGTKHKEHRNLKEVRNYVGKVDIGGVEYYVRFTVNIQKGDNGVHSYFVTEVDVYENTAKSASASVKDGTRLAPSGIVDTKLGTFLENAIFAYENSSKIVDANGEPKVVEHSTRNDDFYTFDISHLGESSGDEGVYGAGFYFGNMGETELYGDRTIQTYLNLRNPFILPDAPIIGFFDYIVKNFDKEELRDIVVKQGNKSATMGDVVDAIKAVNEAHAQGEYAELIEQMSEYWYPAEDRVLEQQIFRKIGLAIYPTLEPFIQYNVGRKEFSEALRNAGYDGVIYDNQEYIAFEPNQIKSATENVGTFDAGNNDIRFRTAPAFYSNAERAVENIKQEKATPEQWLKMIEKNGGLKAGEDKWLGLSDWLKASDKKTLTKQEVLDYIKANEIQIEEVHYGDASTGVPSDFASALRKEMRAFAEDSVRASMEDFADREYYTEEDAFVETARALEENLEAKYGEGAQYFFSLSEDYEIVGGGSDRDFTDFADVVWSKNNGKLVGAMHPINSTRIQYTTDGLDNKREIALTVPSIESWNESDEIHFGDAGNGRAVAWVRFGETTDADGNRVLVIDEVQSKRHQEGREKGYNNPRVIEIFTRLADIESNLYSPQGLSMEMQSEREALKAELESIFENDNPVMKSIAEQLDEKKSKRTALLKEKSEREDDERVEIIKLQNKQDEVRNVRDYDYYESEIDKIKERIDQRNEELDLLASNITALNIEYSRYYNTEIRNARVGVSPAPFEKNWAELAMKRMLRYAAENGFDKVAWTTGEQQAERYSLGAVMQGLKAYKTSPNTYYVIPYNNGAIGEFVKEYNEKELAETFGKEIAVSIITNTENATEENPYEMTGDDLRIGGSGMKAFYDQMMPSFMNKYGKKWGVKVGEVTMPNLEENNTMHSVDVTPAMRESVMQGQPIFRVVKENLGREEAQAQEDGMNPLTLLTYRNLLRQSFRYDDTYGYVDDRIEQVEQELSEGENGEWHTNALKSIQAREGERFDEDYTRNYLIQQKEQELEGLLKEREKRDFAAKAKLKARELQSYLETLGYKKVYNAPYTSYTDVGTSTYITMETPDGKTEKFRISDHPLYGLRSVDEFNVGIEEDVKAFVEDSYEYQKASHKRGVINTSFRVTESKVRFDELQQEYDVLDKNDEAALNAWRDKKVGVVRDYLEGVAQRFGMKPDIVVFNGADEAQMKEAYGRVLESYKKNDGNNPPLFEAFKAHSLKPRVRATYKQGGMVITLNVSTQDEYNDTNSFAGVLFHENAHHLAYILFNDNKRGRLWSDVVNTEYDIVKYINDEYPDKSYESKGGEIIAYSIQNLVENHKASFLQFIRGEKGMTAGRLVEELKFNEINVNFAIIDVLNAIKDEYTVQVSRRGNTSRMGGVGYGGDIRTAEGNSRPTSGRIDSRGGSRSRLLDSVSKKGLREVVGNDNYNEFFNRLYGNVDIETRRAITDYAIDNNWDYDTGINQYLTSLAENENTPLDNGVRESFMRMLEATGVDAEGLTDNDIRYMLWRSTLKDNGALSVAEDVVMKQKLGVDNAQPAANTSFRVANDSLAHRVKNVLNEYDNAEDIYTINDVADHIEEIINEYDGNESTTDLENILNDFRDAQNDANRWGYRMESGGEDAFEEALRLYAANGNGNPSFRVVSNGRSIRDKYDKRVNTGKGKLKATAYNFQEAFQDEMLSLKIYQQLLEEVYGVNIPSYLNVYNAENSLSSRNKEEMDRFVKTLYEDMMQQIDKLIKAGATEQEVRDYVISKSGIERSIEFTVRDYINEQAEATLITEKEAKEQLDEVNEMLRNNAITPMEADARRQRINRSRNTKKYDAEAIEGMRKLYEEKRDALRERLNRGEISFDKWALESRALAESYTGKEVTDKAGLTGMVKRLGIEDKYWFSNARKIVEEFEEKYDVIKKKKTGKVIAKDVIRSLWSAIDKCNNAPLKKLYDTGMISKDSYDKLQKQFMFYVPMSGFTEDVAEDVYSYIGNETGAFTPPLKTAGGRLSESDDPFAIIGNKMQSAILQGNRNAMKIKFLNLHRQFPTDLISEGRFWEVKQPDGSWQVQYPEIPGKDASAEKVKAAVDEFNERMKRYQATGDARIHKGKTNIPYKITRQSHENQHQITVRFMGEPITMFVNGNPQLAKAINGKLKSTTTFWLYKGLASMNRYMSSIVTSFNPDFVAPNVVRDVQQAFTMTLMDYGVKDAGKLAGLLPTALATTIKYAYDAKIDTQQKALYEEFLRNGGQTGYSHIDDIDKWKSQNRRRIDRLSGASKVAQGAVDGFLFAKDGISTINGFFEDTTRFATYMLNRQNGKSIADSIKAAKDISTNFNKKGSGATEGIWGAAAEFLRHWIMFFNPMVQGAYQHWDKMKKHTKKYALITAWNIGLGFTAALLNDMASEDDDEEKKYLNQNEYTRRSNLFIYIGDSYIKIPLAPVFREYYAIGDIIYTAIKGRITSWQATKAIFNTVRSIFNLEGQSSLTGKDGEDFRFVKFILPESLGGIADIAENANFMGSPIYRDATWDELKPEYEKVYNGTWQPLINISKGINNMLATDVKDETLSKHSGKVAPKNSSILLNPAVWQYAIEQATGGIGSTIGNTINTVDAAFDPERELEWNSVPIVRRFYTVPNERNRSRNLQSNYYEITKEQKRIKEMYDYEKADTEGRADKILEQLQAEENAYLERVKATKNDSLHTAEVVDDYHTKEKIENRKNRLAEAERLRQQFKAYQESPDGQFYLKTEEIIKAVDKLRREIKKVEDDNLKKQKKSEMEAKMQELVDLWKADERK